MRNILIVIDMQNDFIDGSLGTKEAEAIVDNVVEKIKSYDPEDVFATRDTHQPDYLDTQEGRFLPVVHCVENTSGWQFDKKVGKAAEKLENAEIINKPTFGSEQLIELLKEENEKEAIGRITLIGLCTDICVVSNALMVKAAFPEMDVRVLKDCCAGVTPETHEAALTTMKMCQIVIE